MTKKMNDLPKSNSLKTARYVAWVAIAAFSAVLAGLLIWRELRPADHSPRVIVTGEALIKNEFSLTDHTGRPVTEADYMGRWQLVFFGFTYCPDICPTTLAFVANVLDLLGEEADHVAPLFITVDPTRDTPEVLADYMAAFHPRLIGLTGSEAETAAAEQAFRVFSEKRLDDSAPDGYTLAHSGYIYLMTPKGKYDAVFVEGRETPETVAEQILMRIEKGK